jgi:hypothetical protein
MNSIDFDVFLSLDVTLLPKFIVLPSCSVEPAAADRLYIGQPVAPMTAISF